MENEPVILFYGTVWCFDCRRARKILDTHKIQYTWINIDKDPEASKLIEKINNGFRSVPTLIFPDGNILVEPSDNELNQAIQKYTDLSL